MTELERLAMYLWAVFLSGSGVGFICLGVKVFLKILK